MMNFQVARLPELHFAAGAVAQTGPSARAFGRRALLITGAASFDRLDERFSIREGLNQAGLETVARIPVSGEPSPALVDARVAEYRDAGIEVVIAIGGGSVLDAAKCIAGLLPSGDSVMEYLEGVGHGKNYRGGSLALVAVPTTAGTGSEMSMNGVLSDHEQGFKKSFRHPSLVPRVAIVDPDLLSTSPRDLIAANGCDALSQLLESYLSTRASPFTDALAESAIEQIGRGLLPLWHSAGADPGARSAVAYASMVSGITLANAGLGAVHGLAGPLGGLFRAPHGVICGSLLGSGNAINIEALLARAPDAVALEKYTTIAERLGFSQPGMAREESLQRLVEGLTRWLEQMQIPRLSAFGIQPEDVGRIVDLADQKANPVVLTREEFERILRERI